MQQRIRAVYGAVLLAIATGLAVVVERAWSDPATAGYVALFGVAGASYLASTRPPSGVESRHLWGVGEASVGLAFLAMVLAGEFDALPWVVALLVGALVAGIQLWQGARRVRGVDDPGGSWTW